MGFANRVVIRSGKSGGVATSISRISSCGCHVVLACVLVSRYRSSAHGLREAGRWLSNGWIVLGLQALLLVTCREGYNSSALSVAEYSKLGQLDLVAHTDAQQSVFPKVSNVSHCVPDSGDMPNTQNAITYAAKIRVSLTRPQAVGVEDGTHGAMARRNRADPSNIGLF